MTPRHNAAKIDPVRLADMMAREREAFVRARPRSHALAQQASRLLLSGVPMPWMTEWGTPFPVFVRRASGAHLFDADDHTYVDFCLGDTGAMFGHASAPAAEAVANQVWRGTTFMLPTEDAIAAAQQLSQRFGLDRWQMATSATDANRFAIKIAREVTGRRYVLVFNGCYHGTVDEAVCRLQDGCVVPTPRSVGVGTDPSLTTRVVEFNDVEGLERILSANDVACVLTEPALTNVGMVLPEEGFHRRLRELTRAAGTLLIIDETHTISAGPGGCTRAWGLEPDILTLGKAVAGGLPVGVYGLTSELAARTEARLAELGPYGIGGTLAGSALAVSALRATLERAMTDTAYERMIELATRIEDGLLEAIATCGLAWHVARIGARVEHHFRPQPFRNGAEAIAGGERELSAFIHLYCLNRGVLLTPFHGMALVSPATTHADVERYLSAFRAGVDELTA